MRTVTYRLVDLIRATIPLGFRGENEHTRVIFDCKKAFTEYPTAIPSLAVTPPQGNTYPAVTVRDGDIVYWDVLDSDVAYNGDGEGQLTFTVDGVIAKSYIFKTKIDRSILPTGEAPDPVEDWIREANTVLNGIPQLVEEDVDSAMDAISAEAETLSPGSSATASYDNETKTFTIGVPEGQKGDPGEDGHSPVVTAEKAGKATTISVDGTPIATINDGDDGKDGEDGFSPVAVVSKAGKVATISVTDKDGTTTATVSDGENGQDGISPVATVTKSGDTATVSITDRNGTTTAQIVDGKDGEDGQDGYSPSASVEKSGDTATITITDKDGTTTATVSDGQDGQPGEGVASGGTTGQVLKKASGTDYDTEWADEYSGDDKSPAIIKSVSGSIATITDGADSMPMDVTVSIEPVQSGSGDPAPDNVRPISGWTGCNVSRTGINVWDEEWEVGLINATTGQNTDSDQYSRTKNFISLIPGKVYYFKNIPTPLYMRRYGRNKEYIGYGQLNGNASWECPSDVYFIRFCWDGTTYSNDISINYPSTDTDYHSGANNAVYPVTWQTEAGTVYGGSLDVTTGLLTVDWVSQTVDQNSNVERLDDNRCYVVINENSFTNTNSNIADGHIISDRFKNISNNSSLNAPGVLIRANGSHQAVISMRGTGANLLSKADWIAWFTSNHVQLVYELATPQTYQLSPTEITTLLHCNVWADTGDILSCEYPADTKAYVDAQGGGVTITIDDAISATSENPVQNKVIKTALDGKEPKHNTTTVSGTTPSITGAADTRYICGECSTLSITAPASGCIDVTFTSGSTPTVLTVTPTKTGVTAIEWADGFNPNAIAANATYWLKIIDGEYGVATAWGVPSGGGGEKPWNHLNFTVTDSSEYTTAINIVNTDQINEILITGKAVFDSYDGLNTFIGNKMIYAIGNNSISATNNNVGLYTSRNYDVWLGRYGFSQWTGLDAVFGNNLNPYERSDGTGNIQISSRWKNKTFIEGTNLDIYWR